MHLRTPLLPLLFTTLTTLLSVKASSDVVDLTAGTFEKEVLSEKLALVEFFAPWCGHCKNLAPHYEEAATALKSHAAAESVGGSIKLAKVDCTVEQDLCGQYGIKGYPTLKVFRSGSPTDYSGPRKADGIISYMLKQALPAVSEVTSENHDDFKGLENVVVLAYYPSGSAPKAFHSIADKLRESYLFGHSTDKSLAPSSLSSNGIVLYKRFDEGTVVFTGNPEDEDALTAFIAENALPLVDEVSPENFATYAETGLPLGYIFIQPDDSKLQQIVESVKPIAKEYKNKVNFVWIDADKFAEHGKSLSVSQDNLPAFVIQDLGNKGKKYVSPSSVSPQSVKDFVGKFVAGSLQPTLKSAAIPATQDESVYTLVTDEFDKVVMDDEKDVFIEFYAPWCGHCQRLAPIWETLAEHFEEFSETLTIAKMDATENDLPLSAPFEIAGFPTLKFKRAGTKDFIDYNGDRSLESLIEFVMENSNNSIESVSADEVEMGVVEGDGDAEERDVHDEL